MDDLPGESEQQVPAGQGIGGMSVEPEVVVAPQRVEVEAPSAVVSEQAELRNSAEASQPSPLRVDVEQDREVEPGLESPTKKARTTNP